MDPNAALAEIRRLLTVVLDDSEEARYVDTGDCLNLAEQVRYLIDWLSAGGFAPDWSAGR